MKNTEEIRAEFANVAGWKSNAPVELSKSPKLIGRECWRVSKRWLRHWLSECTSGKHALQQLQSKVELLEAENQLLREQVNRTSANSSQPPSQDPPSGFKPSQKTKSGKKRGAQPGHEGHERRLYSLEQCDKVTDYYPETCWYCEAPLQGEDPVPYRHQVVEIPPVKLQIEEHRFHQLTCAGCGAATRALNPDLLAQGGYGERVVAHVGLLSSVYRHSHRMVQRALQDINGSGDLAG